MLYLGCYILLLSQCLDTTCANVVEPRTEHVSSQSYLPEMASRISSLELKYEIYTEDRQQMFKYFDVISEALKRLMRIEAENDLLKQSVQEVNVLKQSVQKLQSERQERVQEVENQRIENLELTQQIENLKQIVEDMRIQHRTDNGTLSTLIEDMKNQHSEDNNTLNTILHTLDEKVENQQVFLENQNHSLDVTRGLVREVLRGLDLTESYPSEDVQKNETVITTEIRDSENQIFEFQLDQRFRHVHEDYMDILNFTVAKLDKVNEKCLKYNEQRIKEAISNAYQQRQRRDVQDIPTILDPSLKIVKRSLDVLNLTIALLDKQNDQCLKNNVLMIKRAIAEYEVHTKGKACKDLFDKGVKPDGVYTIFPAEDIPFSAYCDMTNGGWTVIQRRENGDVSFDHNWEKYAEGFGDTDNDHWLGLRHVHYLTENKPSQIHFRFLMKETRIYATAMYDGFYIENEAAKFRMHVQPNATYNSEIKKYVDHDNLFYYHNNMMFSTRDADNDGSTSSCIWNRGPFWYNDCWRLVSNAMFSKMAIWSRNNSPYSTYYIYSEIKIKRSNK